MAIELATLGKGAGKGAALAPAKRSKPLAARERMFFTERLALLLETGHSLHVALDTLASQSNSKALREVIVDLRESVTRGATFSAALRHHREAFSATYVNLVRAAEQGGFLPKVLDELVALERKADALRATVVGALSYPAFLLAFSTAVVAFVLAFVFPKFADMFAAIADELPLSTRVLMMVSDVLVYYWPWLLVGAGALGGAAWGWLRSPRGALAIDDLKLKIPLVKDLVVEIYLVQTLRVMSLSLAHGVTVVEALTACRDVVPNRRFRGFVDDVIGEVEQGRGLARGFEQCTFLPPLVQQMVRTGEESARLPLVLERVVGFYESELNRPLRAGAKLVEPLMLLVMGTVVGVIVASLILPIFKLSNAVN